MYYCCEIPFCVIKTLQNSCRDRRQNRDDFCADWVTGRGYKGTFLGHGNILDLDRDVHLSKLFKLYS